MGEGNTNLVKQVGIKPARDEKGRLLPGNTANPNGRPPKGHSITDTIKAMMDERPEIKMALGSKIIQLALGGDLTAIRTIWAYMDGLPGQFQINTQINIGGEMGVKVTEYDPNSSTQETT